MTPRRLCDASVHEIYITTNVNMKVAEQCRTAASKGNHVLGMIRRNITHKEKSLIVPLYKAIVRPHLKYCIHAGKEAVSEERHNLKKYRGEQLNSFQD